MYHAESEFLDLIKSKASIYHFCKKNLGTFNDIFLKTMSSENLIYGLNTIPPYIDISDNNDIIGILGATEKNLNYFVLKPFNTTLVSVPLNPLSSCNEDGHCSGYIVGLQSGQYHYSGVFTEDQLSSKMINITIGPRIRSNYCYILHNSVVHNHLQLSNAVTSLLVFEVKFWLLLLTNFLALIFLLSRLETSISFIRWPRVLFEYSTGQQFQKISSWIVKLCLLFYLITIFLNGALFSGSLQTGLTMDIKFDPVDSFKDIVKKNYQTVVTLGSFCHHAIKLSDSSSIMKIAESMRSLDPLVTTAEQYEKAILNHNNALVANELAVIRFYSFFCADIKTQHHARRIYRSKKPVLSAHQYLLLSNSLSSVIAKKVIKFGYAAYETGNLQNMKILQIDAESFTNKRVNPNCLQPLKSNKQSITAAINFSYFKTLLFICSAMLCLSSVLFLSELCYQRQYNPVKNLQNDNRSENSNQASSEFKVNQFDYQMISRSNIDYQPAIYITLN